MCSSLSGRILLDFLSPFLPHLGANVQLELKNDFPSIGRFRQWILSLSLNTGEKEPKRVLPPRRFCHDWRLKRRRRFFGRTDRGRPLAGGEGTRGKAFSFHWEIHAIFSLFLWGLSLSLSLSVEQRNKSAIHSTVWPCGFSLFLLFFLSLSAHLLLDFSVGNTRNCVEKINDEI